jgi:SAM-dependent methyltransferase
MRVPGNEEQEEYWNGPGARRWVKYQEKLDGMLESFGRLAIEAARIQPDEHVVDVGCGCGATALTIAEAVGPRGAVLGVDVSAPMVEVARARARQRNLVNASFVAADASSHAFDARYDLLFSRFGVMFFCDPAGAFANLRRALRPGGRLAFVCWAAIDENPWFAIPMSAATTIVPPPPLTAPDDPGPFSLSDPTRVRTILESAGFAEARIERTSPPFVLGPDLDTAATNGIETGPVSRLLLDADEATRQRVRAAICERLAPSAGPEGVVLASAAWVVTARAKEA